MRITSVDCFPESPAGTGKIGQTDRDDSEAGKKVVRANLLRTCPACGEIVDGSRARREGSMVTCRKCVPSSRQQGERMRDAFETIRMHCRNRISGCTEQLASADLSGHENYCEFRPVRCAWHLQCGAKDISFRSYRQHLSSVHQAYVKKIRLGVECDVSVGLRGCRSLCVSTVVCDEKKQLYFTRRCSIDFDKDAFMICVHFVGDRMQAEKFLYSVKIRQGIDSMNAFCEYSAFCGPCIEAPNAPDAHSKCIPLHPKKLFLTGDRIQELKYSVTIRRMKVDSR